MSEMVKICEMSPRDGLQNEQSLVATADKIRLIDLLSQTGLTHIEATSFVSPRAVPQMADAAEVMAGITRAPGVTYAVLTPNMKGYEAARLAGADEVAVFGSASEGFSQANLRRSIAESLEGFQPVVDIATKGDERPVRGYVSCVVACPYDGPTNPEAVLHVAEKLLEMGCYEISLGDTIGVGTPETVAPLLERLLKTIPADRLAGHFHDTGGRALDNIRLSLDHGVRVFDASAGGLGGCPYAPGASGNIATEAVVGLVEGAGFATGVDPEKLAEAGFFAQSLRTTSQQEATS
ncbi:MAG: hydroxymethylglutaryl-CoA lyase [Rhodobacteraceae bacterium]|nr:hydroxymethylglutaryl-CoA lyase [Paracoccaceae bacterium]